MTLDIYILVDGWVDRYMTSLLWEYYLISAVLFRACCLHCRYDRVVFACSLESDFALLPCGDQTEIGAPRHILDTYVYCIFIICIAVV